MKRFACLVFSCVLMLAALCPAALAVDESRSYTFDLAVNGSNEVHVNPGDIVTVVFTLRRTDSGDPYTMYAMQNEIRYDDEFVRPVENGVIVNSSVQNQDIALRGGDRAFYMNYVSFADGEEWNANQLVGTFQLEVLGTAGATVLKNENCLVSLRDGSDSYASEVNDLTLIVSSDCIVHFETNGGTVLDDINVLYGEMIPRPEDPVREGYHLEGWYSDIDLTQAWDFETMPVQSNMTLYAKWAEGDPEPDSIWTIIGNWFRNLFDSIGELLDDFDLSGLGDWIGGVGKYLLLAIPGLLILLLLILLLCRRKRKVIFVTNGGAPIDPIKVKRGDKLENLPVPVRGYSIFCGWYKDERFTDPWYAGVDKVTKRKTKLYAKWL